MDHVFVFRSSEAGDFFKQKELWLSSQRILVDDLGGCFGGKLLLWREGEDKTWSSSKF